jgi:hypothetical protein
MEINSNQNIIVSVDNIETFDNNNNHDNANMNDNNNNAKAKYKLYLSEGVGWIGSVLVLIPYVVPFTKTIDFVLNTLGASGLFVVCVTSKQYQSVVINAAWIVGGIYKYFFSSL